MKKIFVHIGTHKTGSTAIQRFLAKNRHNLIQYNYKYDFVSEGEINHCNLDFMAEGKGLELNKNFNYIFSNENLYTNFFNIKDFLLDKVADFEVNIIIYLRRQDIMKQAVYNQVVKTSGFTGKIYQDHHYNLNYYSFLNKLSAIFPKKNIIVRPYESSQFYGGSIYADFLNILNINLSSEFLVNDFIFNPSLSNDKLEYCLYINKLDLPVSLRTQINELVVRSESIKEGNQIFREHNTLPPFRRRKIIDYYGPSNTKIAKEFLNRDDGRLFKDPQPETNGTWKKPPSINYKTALSITKFIYTLNKKLLYSAFKHIVSSSKNSNSYNEAKDFLLPIFKNVLSNIEIDALKQGKSEKDLLRNKFESSDLHCIINTENFIDLTSSFSPDISHKAAVNGHIELLSKGGDPYFELFPITGNRGNIIYIKLIIDSPDKTFAECFFKINGNSHYLNESYIRKELNKGLNETYFVIDDERFNGQLRIDPGLIAGIYKIKEIVIKTGLRD